MSKMFVKTGDTVQVLSGKSKGVQGEVIAVSPKENKVIVKNVNVVTKHVKPSKMGEQGGLQLVCPKCKQPTRVGHKKGGIRVCKNKECGHEF